MSGFRYRDGPVVAESGLPGCEHIRDEADGPVKFGSTQRFS
jgi:hypothetical protein